VSGRAPGAAAPAGPRLARPAWLSRWLVIGSLAWLAAVVVAGFLFFSVLVPRERRLAVEAWERRLQAQLDDRERAVAEWLDDARRGAAYLAGLPEIAAALGPAAPDGGVRTMAAPPTEVTREDDFVAIWVLDAALAPRAVTPGAAPLVARCLGVAARVAASGREHLEFARCGGARPLAVFAAPVATPAGSDPTGVVVVAVDPARWLYPTLASESAPSATGEVLLVGRAGDRAVYLSPLRHGAAPATTLALPATAELAAHQALAGGAAAVREVDYRGVRVIAAGRPLSGTSMALLAKIDEDEALAPSRQHTRELGVVAAALLLVLAAAGIALWRGTRAAHYKALAASRAEIAELFEHGPDAGVAIVDGRITAANRAAGDLFRCAPRELVGTYQWQLDPRVQPDGSSSETAMRSWLGGMVPGERRRLDWRCLRRDGSEFDAEISVSILPGTPPRALAWLRDVSEERAARERMRLLVEGSPRFFFYVQELDGALSYVSPSVESITGRSVTAWLERTDWFATGSPLNEAARRRTREHLRGEISAAPALVEVEHADGHAVMLEVYEFGRYAGPRLVGLHGIAHDVSERVRAAEALARSEGRFRTLVASLGEGVGVVDPEERIVHANPAAERIFGVAPGGAIGRSLAEFVTPESLERVRSEASRRHAGETGTYEIEVVRGDGTHRWILLTATPQLGRGGELEGAFAIFRDVTEARQLQQLLVQAQKMEAVGRLAGGIAHDFNNLLQAMQGLSEALALRADDPEHSRAAARELGAHIRRGASLARQLLLFSRRETTRFTVVDLAAHLEQAVGLLRRLVRENVVIRCEPAGEALPVRGDPGQLEQVLVNLAVNAADAMPEGGTLTVRSGRGGPATVWFSVSDTGHGVPEEIRGRIFEPYFTTKSVEKGTGLGLSVVHGIVSAHGGTIALESEAGAGATFTVTLPRADAAVAPASAHPPAASPVAAAASGKRILVVEDEAAARESLAELLAMLGYEVVAMGSGEEAGVLPAEPPFDLLLTDVLLPGVSGSDLARGLCDRWPSLKVVLMSGYTEDEAVRTAVLSGSVRFLQKPFTIDMLARELHAALAAADR